MQKKIIIWSLFDSGNSCYKKVFSKDENIENYSIGIDIERKNKDIINLDLSDYSFLFGPDNLMETLKKLPAPDLIIASPPCESWSNLSSRPLGNYCWKQESLASLIPNGVVMSPFTIRDHDDFNFALDNKFCNLPKGIITRINGELTIFNTIRIIKKFSPKVFIIENPAFGRIWEYIHRVLGFKLIKYENLTYYNNYGFTYLKPTKFASNINLSLNREKRPVEINLRRVPTYNEKSDIPELLISHILNEVTEYLKEKEE